LVKSVKIEGGGETRGKKNGIGFLGEPKNTKTLRETSKHLDDGA